MKKLKLALIGKDVSRSESERMHRFILQGKGAACDYENVSVGAESFGKEAGRLLKETDGFNVTIPYKKSIIALLNETKGDAAAFDSVNTVLSAQKTGYNTDGVGFLLMLRRAGVRTQDRRALVLGAGGAGRSTAASLKKAGAEVFLYQRRQELLKDVCFSLGVRASLDTLVKRLKVYDNRPLLQADSGVIADKLAELLRVRMPVYEHVADFIVDVDGKSVEESAAAVIQTVENAALKKASEKERTEGTGI